MEDAESTATCAVVLLDEAANPAAFAK